MEGKFNEQSKINPAWIVSVFFIGSKGELNRP
jgi:hypothetical protein